MNVTILFYQLGMCSVAILFISDNMVHLLGHYFPEYSDHTKMVIMASIVLPPILITNLFTEMRVVSAFAMASSIFFLLGTVFIMQYAIQQPNQWQNLPASTNFTGTIMVVLRRAKANCSLLVRWHEHVCIRRPDDDFAGRK